MKTLLRILLLLFVELSAVACIWDADTLSQEQHKSPDIAKVILGTTIEPENPQRLQERIKTLEADRHENDPEWWNNLAGAYIRLNQLETAIKILEPLREKFPDDYGIHANLGTAYHLAGRYPDAEKEIARDLEINPEAHFGLEKYHLALLQYLIRDKEYQKNHVYVDEFSEAALHGEWNKLSLLPLNHVNTANILSPTNSRSQVPSYRFKWNLAGDTNLQAGAIYMATLNPREPACFTMLGLACLGDWGYRRNLHLAVAAFQKAVQLGSPQSEVLKERVNLINKHLRVAWGTKIGPTLIIFLLSAWIASVVFRVIRARKNR
ncbi:MAG: hypothetical protein QOD03_47 [Verrucomicrobiota bacterium]|jgi:tetratricopeptide (TPR) repeat protein